MSTKLIAAQIALKRAYSSSDVAVLTATFLTFFLMTSIYFVVSYLMGEEFVQASGVDILLGIMDALFAGGMLFIGILLFGMFIVRMMRQTILGNSLQVEYSNYAWLRDWANEVSAELRLPRVEIFVTQDPVINAYAFGFTNPYCIVLNSGSIRYLTKQELKVIVVHEMAHIKYGHTIASVYLQPFMSLPVVGVVAQWLAGFWQRRAELTADRLALMFTKDATLVKEALIKVHVGPDVAKAMNQIAQDWLRYTSERPMNRFAQTFSSHPFLVRRLSHIDRWSAVIDADVSARAVAE